MTEILFIMSHHLCYDSHSALTITLQCGYSVEREVRGKELLGVPGTDGHPVASCPCASIPGPDPAPQGVWETGCLAVSAP